MPACQGRIPTLDVCSRNRTAQMGQVQVHCREHNTWRFVLRNVSLEGVGSNQKPSLSLRCPLSLMPVSGHHDRACWSACLSIEMAPGTNKNGPITGPMKQRGSNGPSYLLLSPRLSIVQIISYSMPEDKGTVFKNSEHSYRSEKTSRSHFDAVFGRTFLFQ